MRVFVKRRRSSSGRVKIRKATRVELRDFRNRKPTTTAIRWQTTPRSQLVQPEARKESSSVGFLDYGGKYYK